ncbi:UDP-N-acetylmuramate--L-alanine ligase [Wenzhouxiangella sediminis]|nr:UDP-N-acetylmuramate--L-alanine ligase [Wenzhouxiangella sediminis]
MIERTQTPNLMHRTRCIHLVGIGGAGMCGIAEVLLNLGFEVTGSDLQASTTVSRLQEQGAEIRIGHATENLGDADVVVVSGAVPEDNPEVIAARERRIPVIARAEMLGELMRFRQGIAVAGTHGKTTTTSLVATLLAEGGLDPTFIVGGLVNAFGTGARLGEGRYIVAEADESDGSFLKLQPVISVITNIDRDHLDAYQGSFDQLQRAFLEFLHHLPFFGVAVLCIDDAHVAELIPDVGRAVVTYGLDEQADVRATNLRQEGRRMHFDLCLPGEERPRAVSLAQPGRHNVLNALGAAAVASEIGIPADAIVRGLAGFGGIGRRFAEIGPLDVAGNAVLAFEDYGHHPTELEAVVQAAREGWPDRRLVLFFQPHRYTRTRDQFDDFARVLADADALILADIYPAGEKPLSGIDSDALAKAVGRRRELPLRRIGAVDEVVEILPELVGDGDLLLVMGAGDVGRLGALLKKRYAGEAA